jgi:hypothetical protein
LFFLPAKRKPFQKKINKEVLSSTKAGEHGHRKQTNTYSSEVVLEWMNMQLELIRTATIQLFPHQNRYIAFSGLALYEAVVPGMPAYQSIAPQLQGLQRMPETQPGHAYHWPTSANATLACINKKFFTSANTSASNLTAMTELENSLNATYQAEINPEVFQRSVEFGKAVAETIYNWSLTDGAAASYPAFVPTVPPAHMGEWVPTPPGFAYFPSAITPYWGKIRFFVNGSSEGSFPPPPPAYSIDPSSEYYKMHKEVYDVSQTLTSEQTAIALFWRDNPGYAGPGHFLNIAKQILQKENAMLDLAALVYAKVGITQADASVACIDAKYFYYTERPITYIRTVLGKPTWNALFNTPPFPDYPSLHSADCGAIGEILSQFFGDDYKFTDDSYSYLAMAPRSYNSFQELFDEMINARVYAGIHTRQADIAGVNQGRKIAQNIDRKLKFKK